MSSIGGSWNTTRRRTHAEKYLKLSSTESIIEARMKSHRKHFLVPLQAFGNYTNCYGSEAVTLSLLRVAVFLISESYKEVLMLLRVLYIFAAECGRTSCYGNICGEICLLSLVLWIFLALFLFEHQEVPFILWAHLVFSLPNEVSNAFWWTIKLRKNKLLFENKIVKMKNRKMPGVEGTPH